VHQEIAQGARDSATTRLQRESHISNGCAPKADSLCNVLARGTTAMSAARSRVARETVSAPDSGASMSTEGAADGEHQAAPWRLLEGALPRRRTQLRRLTRPHVEAWVKEMATRGLAPGTIKTRVNNVRSVIRAAVRDRRIPTTHRQACRSPDSAGSTRRCACRPPRRWVHFSSPPAGTFDRSSPCARSPASASAGGRDSAG
jgi:hypothetical protein